MADAVSIVLIGNDGAETVLKSGLKLEAGEVVFVLFFYKPSFDLLSFNHIVIIRSYLVRFSNSQRVGEPDKVTSCRQVIVSSVSSLGILYHRALAGD